LESCVGALLSSSVFQGLRELQMDDRIFQRKG
jgi:hypothetical protein